MAERTGGCLCGGVRWRAGAAPFRSVHCHCRSCRRATGAALASYAGFAKAAVTWQGARALRASAPGVTRGGCPDCRTPLSYMCTRWPGELYLHAATLDDPALFTPQAHLHWAERVPWLALADGLPKYPGRGPSALTPPAGGPG